MSGTPCKHCGRETGRLSICPDTICRTAHVSDRIREDAVARQALLPTLCAWRGNAWSQRDVRECKSAATAGSMCAVHAAVSCCCCNAQATHECPECLQFVCGAPLCDGCEHKPGGYSYDHVRRTVKGTSGCAVTATSPAARCVGCNTEAALDADLICPTCVIRRASFHLGVEDGRRRAFGEAADLLGRLAADNERQANEGPKVQRETHAAAARCRRADATRIRDLACDDEEPSS